MQQLKATAYDTFYPDNKAKTTVRINVRRNQNEPQFSQSAYETEINEYHQFGVLVLTVSAADADRVRIDFGMIMRERKRERERKRDRLIANPTTVCPKLMLLQVLVI